MYVLKLENDMIFVIRSKDFLLQMCPRFFEDDVVKTDLKAEFAAAQRRPLTTTETSRTQQKDSADDQARRAAEEERRKREAEKRRRTDNWDDGRGRR